MDRMLVLAVVGLTLAAAALGILNAVATNGGDEEFSLIPTSDPAELTTFTSVQYRGGVVGAIYPLAAAANTVKGSTESEAGESVDRYSQTNVQVLGIDEPDVLKINGNCAFFQSYGRVKIMDIWPPKDLNVLSKIEQRGDLLLEGNTLVVLSWNSVEGYDVSDPSAPKKVWSLDLNGNYVDARLYDGKIYLVTRDYRITCPYVVAKDVTIPCSRYYHPIIPMPQDVTYTILKIDSKSGEIEKSVALTGTYQTVIYMSENGIYVAYRVRKDPTEVMYRYVLEEGDKFLPADVMGHLRRVWNYDISVEAKAIEFQKTLERYMRGLGNEEGTDLYARMEKGLEEYVAKRPEMVESTGIARIDLDNLDVVATGSVPGHLINQWAMDERDGYLRVATTVTANWRNHIGNNIYVLDKTMKVVGKIEGLEEGERIYAVRFMGDKAYVVTYRETDPLLVVDISNPRTPRVEGVLKIPGYSTYLHPVGEGKMIGIGKTDRGKVKISLFDVSDPENPKELDSYPIDAWWSEAVRNHHAVLWDEKHRILTIPVGDHFYVLRAGDDKISALKIVREDSSARRAAYVNDYLYLFFDGHVSVLDEENGKIVVERKINQGRNYWPVPPIQPIPVEPV